MEKSGNEDLEKEKAELEKNVETEAQKEIDKEREEERKNVEDPYGYGDANDQDENNDDAVDGEDSDQPNITKKTKGDGGYFGNNNNDDDSDGMTKDAYAKPTRGGGRGRGARGGRGGRKFGGLNKEDFPEL